MGGSRLRSLVLCGLGLLATFGVSPGLAKPQPSAFFQRLEAHVEKVRAALDGLPAAKRPARLAEELAASRDPALTVALLRLVDRWPEAAREAFLVGRLAHPNAAVRRVAVGMLGEVGGPSCVPALELASAQDPTTLDFEGGCLARRGSVRVEAAAALARVRSRLALSSEEGPGRASDAPPSGWLGAAAGP